jgi:hypothetical protein
MLRLYLLALLGLTSSGLAAPPQAAIESSLISRRIARSETALKQQQFQAAIQEGRADAAARLELLDRELKLRALERAEQQRLEQLERALPPETPVQERLQFQRQRFEREHSALELERKLLHPNEVRHPPARGISIPPSLTVIGGP